MSTPNAEGQSLREFLGNYNPDGIWVGNAATDLVGMYGTSPVSQVGNVSQNFPFNLGAYTALGFTTASQVSSLWVYPIGITWCAFTSHVASSLVNCVLAIRSALVNIGLIKGSP